MLEIVVLAVVESLNPVPEFSSDSSFVFFVDSGSLLAGLVDAALAACFVVVVRLGRVDVCVWVDFFAFGILKELCFRALFENVKVMRKYLEREVQPCYSTCTDGV